MQRLPRSSTGLVAKLRDMHSLRRSSENHNHQQPVWVGDWGGVFMNLLKLGGVLGLILIAAVLLAWPMAGDCLALADQRASSERIRLAALADSENPYLCEGLALLQERKTRAAVDQLEAALRLTPEDERWSVEGYLALAYAAEARSEEAIVLWNRAITGAIKAGHQTRELVFRGSRGMQLARDKRFADARADFEIVFRQSDIDGLRASAAYYALAASVSQEDMAAAEHWFPLALEANANVGDYKNVAYSTEVYGQLLDKRMFYDDSAKAYKRGIAIVEKSGDTYLHAELLEMFGQSRFDAGDVEDGTQLYSEAAAMFRKAGRADYAEFLDRNLRAKVGHSEGGGRCVDLLMKQDVNGAIAAADAAPIESQSFETRVCLVHALNQQGNSSRALTELDRLRRESPRHPECETVDAIARQIDPDHRMSGQSACEGQIEARVDAGG